MAVCEPDGGGGLAEASGLEVLSCGGVVEAAQTTGNAGRFEYGRTALSLDEPLEHLCLD